MKTGNIPCAPSWNKIIMDAYTRFIIINVIPQPFYNVAFDMMKRCGINGNSKTALSYPPHLTLRTGVILENQNIPGFIKEFGEVVSLQGPLEVKINGIMTTDHFQDEENNYIAYYNVEKTEKLVNLNNLLLTYHKYKKSYKTDFQPHISICYGDLTRENYNRVASYINTNDSIKNFKTSYILENVCLYINKYGHWEEYHRYNLK
jgi:2'-5' RNA ligase